VLITYNVYAQSLSSGPFTALQTKHWIGEVKSVTTSGGVHMQFDREGEFSEIKFNGKSHPELYESIHIAFPDRWTREEQSSEEDVTQRKIQRWTFDGKGRPIVHQLRYSTISTSVTYYIYDDLQRFPSREITNLYEDYGHSITITKYIYLKFDKTGNWTERHVSVETYTHPRETDTNIGPEILQENKEYVETASYEYWNK